MTYYVNILYVTPLCSFCLTFFYCLFLSLIGRFRGSRLTQKLTDVVLDAEIRARRVKKAVSEAVAILVLCQSLIHSAPERVEPVVAPSPADICCGSAGMPGDGI